jgi:hypothetical protein
MPFEAYWNPKGMVFAPMNIKTTYKDNYLETIKSSGTSQWNWDM